MGRKTLESMGRALPNRVNWVITRDPNWQFDGVKVAHTIEDALNAACADVQGDAHYPEITSDFQKKHTEQHVDEKTNIAFEFATYQK